MSRRACFCRTPPPNSWRGLRQWGSLCRAPVGVKESGAKSVAAGEDSAAFEDGQVKELVVVFEGVSFVAGEDLVGLSFWLGDEGEAEGVGAVGAGLCQAENVVRVLTGQKPQGLANPEVVKTIAEACGESGPV